MSGVIRSKKVETVTLTIRRDETSSYYVLNFLEMRMNYLYELMTFTDEDKNTAVAPASPSPSLTPRQSVHTLRQTKKN